VLTVGDSTARVRHPGIQRGARERLRVARERVTGVKVTTAAGCQRHMVRPWTVSIRMPLRRR